MAFIFAILKDMERIDVETVIRQKYKGYIPRFVFRWLERLICQDEFNRMNQLEYEGGGIGAAETFLKYLNITSEVVGQARLPDKNSRTLFVGNHPLGGMDGLILTHILGKKYGKIKLLVNDVLLNLHQFNDVFIPINKYNTPSRTQMKLISEVLESNTQVLMFPAGLCSRMNKKKQIRDLAWNISFIKMAKRSGRNILPIFFEGENSKKFYRWARIREKLKIKFNYELILLPSEFINARNKHFKVIVGEKILHKNLPARKDMRAFAEKLKNSLYEFPQKYRNK